MRLCKKKQLLQILPRRILLTPLFNLHSNTVLENWKFDLGNFDFILVPISRF